MTVIACKIMYNKCVATAGLNDMTIREKSRI